MLGLHGRDLDLDAGLGTVVQTVVEGPGEPRLSKPKSGRGRSVALDAGSVQALRAHRKRQAGEQLALGPAYGDHGLVFCREDGVPLWPRSLARAFERHAQNTGLPAVRLHDRRHPFTP